MTKSKCKKEKPKAVLSKDNVSFKDQALPEASIFLKGTKSGDYTNSRGNFTFPVALLDGDVLVFEFLGFETKEVKITPETTFIKVVMKEAKESLDMVVLGAPGSKKLFKSKKKKN